MTPLPEPSVSKEPKTNAEVAADLSRRVIGGELKFADRAANFQAILAALDAKDREHREDCERFALSVVPTNLCLTYTGNWKANIMAALIKLQRWPRVPEPKPEGEPSSPEHEPWCAIYSGLGYCSCAALIPPMRRETPVQPPASVPISTPALAAEPTVTADPSWVCKCGYQTMWQSPMPPPVCPECSGIECFVPDVSADIEQADKAQGRTAGSSPATGDNLTAWHLGNQTEARHAGTPAVDDSTKVGPQSHATNLQPTPIPESREEAVLPPGVALAIMQTVPHHIPTKLLEDAITAAIEEARRSALMDAAEWENECIGLQADLDRLHAGFGKLEAERDKLKERDELASAAVRQLEAERDALRGQLEAAENLMKKAEKARAVKDMEAEDRAEAAEAKLRQLLSSPSYMHDAAAMIRNGAEAEAKLRRAVEGLRQCNRLSQSSASYTAMLRVAEVTKSLLAELEGGAS